MEFTEFWLAIMYLNSPANKATLMNYQGLGYYISLLLNLLVFTQAWVASKVKGCLLSIRNFYVFFI